MSGEYIVTTPGPRETLRAAAVALGVAAGVGAVAFYLTRALLARETLDRDLSTPARRAAEADAEAP